MTKHSLTGPDGSMSDIGSMELLQRRSFLFSLGALALTGCGAGSNSTDSASSTLSASRMLASSMMSAGFAHPGLLHRQADIDRMSANINVEPWKSGWAMLVNNPYAKLTYSPAAVPIVYRGYDGVHAENYTRLFKDVAAAYACALRYKITGDAAYGDKAVSIMNLWSSTLTAISGTSDMSLAAGIYGYEFANAGELMRGYSGWAAPDFARFQGMMRNIFYPMNREFLLNHRGTEVTHYWANWDLCNMASTMAIGVLCDEPALFDEAVTYFKEGAGNGAAFKAVYYVHPGYLGQWQETGRDQGHNIMGIGLMGAICEMAWNQGVDLYGYDNNRFLMGAEYVAKANLIEYGTTYHKVPYVTYTNVNKVNQTVLSTVGQGELRPIWALVYHHYVNRKGLAAPWTKKFMEKMQPEGGSGYYNPNSGGFDQLGHGTLTHTLPAIVQGSAPNGLTAYVSGGDIILSWWGGAYDTTYTVERSVKAGGPYTTVASGITDPRTWTDTGLADGTWFYVVKATTPTGESAQSNETSATTGVHPHTKLTFDETSGTVVADGSGNGHAGTLHGGATWTAGKKGNCVALNGTNAYVSLPAGIMDDVGDFTISAWVYWNAARTWDRVFDFGSGTGQYMMLTARGANGFARFAITVNGRDGELYVDSTAALPRSAWSHVAITLSGRTCKFYVNGTLVGSNTNMFQAPFRLQATRQNWIGRSQNSTHPYFNGRIDDFRIYRGALSAEHIVAMMNDQLVYDDLTARVQMMQTGAVLNRATQKYVGSLAITNTGPAIKGPLMLKLSGLTSGVSLDGASGLDGGAPYVLVSELSSGATLTLQQSFTNPARSIVGYTPRLYKTAF